MFLEVSSENYVVFVVLCVVIELIPEWPCLLYMAEGCPVSLTWGAAVYQSATRISTGKIQIW